MRLARLLVVDTVLGSADLGMRRLDIVAKGEDGKETGFATTTRL